MKIREIKSVSDVCQHLDWIHSSRREESCGIDLESFRNRLPYSVVAEKCDSRLAVRAVGLMKAKAFFRGMQGSAKPMKAWLATGGEGDACISAMEAFWKIGLKEATVEKRVGALRSALDGAFTLGKQHAASVKEAKAAKLAAKKAAKLAAKKAEEAKQAASRREALKKQLMELLLEQPDLLKECLEEAAA